MLIEAALARVPVVGSRSGGMPEALEEDAHALFFPIGDAAACADALARVLTDAPETEARTARAFERARQLSLDGYARQAGELLSSAVASHERHLEQHTDNEAARRGRRRPRAADGA